MQRILQTLLCLFSCSYLVSAYATPIDESKTVLCAANEVVDCGRHELCEGSYPEDVNLPAFIRIDFKKKEIIGKDRNAKIEYMSFSDTTIILQGKGVEKNRAWTLMLEKETGRITGGVVGQDYVFAIFGDCTVP